MERKTKPTLGRFQRFREYLDSASVKLWKTRAYEIFGHSNEKTSLILYSNSEYQDQPVDPPDIARPFYVSLFYSQQCANITYANIEGTDQPCACAGLIYSFAVRTKCIFYYRSPLFMLFNT